jgi:DNA-binding NarL/FixJ family response regulator
MSFFEKLYKRSLMPVMSAAERKAANVLLVDPDAGARQVFRQTLANAGFRNIFEAPSHAAALQRIEQQPISHVIFDARKTNMPAKEFLLKTMAYSDQIVTIPASFEPTIDDVFDLLVVGARGYIVRPFTQESLDDAIAMATKGEAISESVLHAKNRNEALASLIMSSFDKLAIIMRQSKKFDTAQAEIPKRIMGFKRAIDIGKTFAQGGSEALVEAIIEFTLEHAEGPASHLGRLRKRLESKKSKSKKTDA